MVYGREDRVVQGKTGWFREEKIGLCRGRQGGLGERR
jgi:hypothetical protein